MAPPMELSICDVMAMLKRPRDDDRMDVSPPATAPQNATVNPFSEIFSRLRCSLQDLNEAVDVKQFESDLKPPVVEYKKEALVGRLEAMAAANDEGKCVEIRIMPEYLSINHKPVKNRQLFGDLIYTHDSDVIAVLMHLGYFRMMDMTPIGMVNVKTIIRLVPNPLVYPSRLRNNLLSRKWHMSERKRKTCGYKVEGCWLVKRDGTLLSLKKNVTDALDYMPTFVPAYSDRTVTTRSTTATAERRQRNLPEQSFLFSLSNEVCLKYSIFAVTDRGLRCWQWTSAKLQDEVMYLETNKERFELARQVTNGMQIDQKTDEVYSWSLCKKIHAQSKMESFGIPQPSYLVDVLHSDLGWEDIKWAPTFVKIEDRSYAIVRLFYLPRS